MQTLTNDQLHKTAIAMSNGNFGSFAMHLGAAYLVADLGNKDRIANAFADLFQKVYVSAIYAPIA